MLWECSECGDTTTRRTRVCRNCGTVTRYMPAEARDYPAEIGSLREHWVSAGAAQSWAPALHPR